MQRTHVFIVVMLLCLPITLAAQPNVFINFVDITTKEQVSDVTLQVDFNGKTTQYFIEKGDKLNLLLDDGQYAIKVLVDKSDSPGFDYLGSSTFLVEENTIKTIHVRPVGSLHGFVKDKLDNVISGAELKFECSRGVAVEYPAQADQFGSFSLDAVPVGDCVVTATYGKAVGSKSIVIGQGQQVKVDIKLDQVLVSGEGLVIEKSNIWGIGVVIVLLLATFVYIAFFRKKKKPSLQATNQESKEVLIKEVDLNAGKLGRRGQDLLQTLRDNEKKIVDFLLEQEKPVYLSKIHHKTGMSKGSIFRNLRSLEHKNIVESFKEGRIRKVKLTDWFLE